MEPKTEAPKLPEMVSKRLNRFQTFWHKDIWLSVEYVLRLKLSKRGRYDVLAASRKRGMCGDHPSFVTTKTELNAKEPPEDKEQPIPLSCAKLASTSARSLRASPRRARSSGHALHVARRAEHEPPIEPHGQSGALVQAALGSFRWPPYLLTVWVLVLVLTHALHCLVSCLERALPRLKTGCEYLRACAEQQWRGDATNRVCPALLLALTALGYALYLCLYVVWSVALWSMEPLAEDKEAEGAKVTDYDESDASLK